MTCNTLYLIELHNGRSFRVFFRFQVHNGRDFIPLVINDGMARGPETELLRDPGLFEPKNETKFIRL